MATVVVGADLNWCVVPSYSFSRHHGGHEGLRNNRHCWGMAGPFIPSHAPAVGKGTAQVLFREGGDDSSWSDFHSCKLLTNKKQVKHI